MDRSGLRELEQVLHTQFTERRDVLKARSALLAVDAVLRTGDGAGPARARWPARSTGSSRERTSSPSCGCWARCAAARSPCRPATPTTASGCWATPAPPPAARLGLAPDAPAPELAEAAYAALERWQRHTVNPMLGRATTDACRAVVRSCEGILAGLA